MSEPAAENLGPVRSNISWLITVFVSRLVYLPSLSFLKPVPEEKASDNDHEAGDARVEDRDEDREIDLEAQEVKDSDSPLPELPDGSSQSKSSPEPDPQADDQNHVLSGDLSSRSGSTKPNDSSDSTGESSRSVSFNSRMYENESSFSSGTSSLTTSKVSKSSSPPKSRLGLKEQYPQIPQVHQKPNSPNSTIVRNLPDIANFLPANENQTPQVHQKPNSPNSTIVRNLINIANFPPANENNQTPSPDIFQKLELPKFVLGLAVTLCPGVLILHFTKTLVFDRTTTVALCLFLLLGVAALWNGIAVQDDFPIHAHRIQMLGYALVLGAFFGLIARFLWPKIYLFMIPVITYVVSVIILVIKAFSKTTS